MKTVSTKHIKKLQENTKIIDINELIHSKKYKFLVTIMSLYRKKFFGINPKGFFIKNNIAFLLTIASVIEDQKLSKSSHAIPVTKKSTE